MPRIPLPRRGLRSYLLLFTLLFGPYLLYRHLHTISSFSEEYVSSVPGLSFFRRSEYDDDGVHARPGSGRANEDRLGDLVVQGDVYDAGSGRRAGGVGGGAGSKGKAPAGKPKAKAEAAVKGKSKPKSKLPQHKYAENGLLLVNPAGQHPIYDLIQRAQDKWDAKLAKASTSLGQAVNEYRRRYGRAPPKGFDRWWDYAQRHSVQLPDEYDQIHKDLEAFHALPSSSLMKLVSDASSKSAMITLYCPGKANGGGPCIYEIEEKGLNEEGKRVAGQRAEGQLSLLRAVEGDLEEVTAILYSHDVPWQFVGHEYKSALEDAASVGEYLDVEEHQLDWAHLGWASACAPHKPLRKSYDHSILPSLDTLWKSEAKSFIWDHRAAMDPCQLPTITHLVGILSGHSKKGPGPSKELYPVMAMCKTFLHSDVSEEAWTEDVGEDPEWDYKTDDRMLWRGKNTGIYFNEETPWEISQRVNLVARTMQSAGNIPVLAVPPEASAVGKPTLTAVSGLNAELVDVGFVDEPIQCEPKQCEAITKTLKYSPRVDWAKSNQYKYLLDLDGNGWSARFKRLMTTNSVVLKSTIFPEWYTDRVQPWVHYVPIKHDLTDLYDVMSFFHEGHDEMAKQIAVEGKKWSQTFWRKEDMVSYQFRLFLEFSRLLAPDRDAASYHVIGSDLDE